MQSCLKKSSAFRKYSIAAYPQFASFKLPNIKNEPMADYAPNSRERIELQKAVNAMKKKIEENGPFQVPAVISGEFILGDNVGAQSVPTNHNLKICHFTKSSPEMVRQVH
jgi:1-pyrroline-5-carboxylate dehydrogenase